MRNVGLGDGAVRTVIALMGIATLLSLLVATAGAVVHFRTAKQLQGARRRVWYVILCFPAFGATLYYLRVMRAQRAGV